jgi:hypothetical protein
MQSTGSARYQLLRQRSQIVNTDYEGAKRQLQRLVSDHGGLVANEESPAPSTTPASPPTTAISAAAAAAAVSHASRALSPVKIRKSSSQVAVSPPTRIRHQSRQNIMAPTRVAPVPVPLRPASAQPAQHQAQPASSKLLLPEPLRAARDATVAAYMACCEQKSRAREQVDTFIKAKFALLRAVREEFAQDASLSSKVMKEVEGKLESSETALRELRDTVQKLEFRIQVVKRAQRSTNVALKCGQILPLLTVVVVCVGALGWLLGFL